MLVEFECPRCKGHVCEVWSLNCSNSVVRFSLWHWIVNPGLAINELVFGQRMPERMFVCKSCEVPMPDRCYVHCPSCDSFHQGRLWSGIGALGHWLGYFCPTCGAQIPCLWNYTSKLILMLTSPIWYLPVRLTRRRLIAVSRKRIGQVRQEKVRLTPLTVKDYRWAGWAYGIGMNLVMTLGLSMLWMGETGEGFSLPVAVMSFCLGGLLWLPAGWLYGQIMKAILHRKGDANMLLTRDHLAVSGPQSINPSELSQFQDADS